MGTKEIKRSISKNVEYQNNWMSSASWIMSDIAGIEGIDGERLAKASGLFADIVRYNLDIIRSMNDLADLMDEIETKADIDARTGKEAGDGQEG